MASGRMEFHADTIMQHANFSFVLPNDVEMEEVFDQRHYDRPTKTLILLHGLTGTDTDWLFGGVAQEMAVQYNLAVFMPTAGNNFYLDRGYRGGNWGSFVGEELPAYIRKVFGSSTQEILRMLCRHYGLLLAVSFVVSAPLAYYIGRQWLQGFAERIAIPWWIFPLALLAVGFVTLATVVTQSWRTASENPVNSIKNE